MRPRLKNQIKKIIQKIRLFQHRHRLLHKLGGMEKRYKEYLDEQLERTYSKSSVPLPERARYFISEIAKHISINNARVLCVGCRNNEEILFWKSLGVKSAIGIDLYSESEDILVMDMHSLTFPDQSFDLVYSSHSLEHSFDPIKVINEFQRVVTSGGHIAIEVPVHYETRGTDRVDFGSSENLLKLFDRNSTKVVWSEEKSRDQDSLTEGTDVLRILVRIDK